MSRPGTPEAASSGGRAGGFAAVAAAAVLWALIGVCTRELGDLGMPARQVGPWRALLGGACFVVQLAVTWRWRGGAAATAAREGARELRSHLGAMAVFTGLGVVVFYAALPLAVETGGLSLAYVLLYTAPVWVVLGVWVWRSQRPTNRQGAAVVLSVAGVAALALSAGGTVQVSAASVAWGLLAGVTYASYYLVGPRLFAAAPPALVYAIALLVGGAVLALLVGLGRPTAAMVPWLVALGVGCTWLPWWLFAMGVTRVPPVAAVVVAMVEPVVATAIGVTAYGERLGAGGVVGAVAVLIAAIVVSTATLSPAAST